jgi:glycosyltransferase involved in cell wall biosynthesis
MAEITVITPFRDAEAYLPGVVANLRRQTFQGWHCLLVDHSSMDQGRAVAEDLIGADPRFRLISVPGRFGFDRQLPAIPRNRALSEVETSLVAFLDVDDLWHPLKLERQLSFHRAHRLELSVTSYCCFRDLRGPAGIWRCPPQALRPEDLRWRNPIPMLTVVASTKLLERGFPLHPHEDYLLWLELWRDHPDLRYGCLRELLAYYRRHDDNLSRRPRQLARWTYGVYRASGTPPLQALGLLLRWGGFHVSQRLRDRLRPCRPTGSVASLLEEPPPVWSRCGR